MGTFTIEIIAVILILGVATYATKTANRKNDADAFHKRELHQQRKLRDLLKEIEELYRTDLTGVLRINLNPAQVDGYTTRYLFLIYEMERNLTLFHIENDELIPILKTALLQLSDKVAFQEKLNQLLGEQAFPTSIEESFPTLEVQKKEIAENDLSNLRSELDYIEKHYHSENEDWSRYTRDLLNKLN
ncbi:MAG: hypothetical protein LBM95_07070 [Lactobacillales bacterium]|jgi:hypothetical protein|nr:hypothetical protein [Lactobacillales bacterium]